jgi:tetratricopeptide (TPR) repeat protein
MQDTLVSESPSSLEQDVARLGGLQQQGRHAEAIDGAEGLLRTWPQNRDLLLIAASSLRRTTRIDEAMAMLDRLEALQPRFSRMHEERGLCHVARKDAANAIASLLRAVNINPALPMSWRMLEGVYRLSGESENAATAAEHLQTLARLPPEVVTATSLFSDGEIAPAEQIVRAFLLRHGDHPEAMRLLAKIGVVHDALDDAETLLAAALALSPDYRAARLDFAQVLVKRQKFSRAHAEAERLLVLDPANLDYRALAATVAIGLGEHEQALDIYRSMLADAPDVADIHLWMGHALKTIGRTPEAIEAYLAAAATRSDFGDAYWSLANLKTFRFADSDVARMRAAESAEATSAEDRVHLAFALGKALADRGAFEASWASYVLGNAMRRAESRYRPEIIETNTARQIGVCTRSFFERRVGWGAASAAPIFIVGLPRSGSTLIEQILASHSKVEGTQELPDVQRIVLELQGRDPDLDDPRYPAALARLTAEEVLRLGERYLAETEVYRTGRPLFIDKMPNNFRHIGLIHLMLPNARIIDARRDPMSCCLSNLKQLFANGQEFTYSTGDIARYYRTYLELMRHWDQVLPDRVLRVQHEDVVDDLEGCVHRLLAHCRLPFEQACVDFHRTERSVRTPSSEQVRQPIFRDGLDQWRNYEPWLEPLKLALGDALVRYRD